jgi:hypothetical protein
MNAKTPAEVGFYRVNCGIFRVKTAPSTGRNYALKLTEDGKWVYAAGAVFNLRPETRMTRDEAAAYGRRFGRCIVCQAELTDPKSVEAGIGPVCAQKF